MDPLQFFAASRLLVVAGKGGVGKTTVTAVAGAAAAESGLRVLVIDVEGKAGLAGLLGGDPDDVLPYDETVLGDDLGPDGTGRISGRTITAGRALIEYLDDHGLRRVSKRLADTGVLDIVSTAAPGIEDILVLGKVKQLERAGSADLIVLDGPAAGHAISFLRVGQRAARRGERRPDPDAGQGRDRDAVRPGPVPGHARDAARGDPGQRVDRDVVRAGGPHRRGARTGGGERCRTAWRDVDPAATDDPDLRAAGDFRQERCGAQAAQLQRLADGLPLPQIVLPFVFAAGLRPDDTAAMVPLFLDAVRALPA